MKEITFKFKDYLTDDRWVTRKCQVSSLDECIRIYGLNESDVEYKIINIVNLNTLESEMKNGEAW